MLFNDAYISKKPKSMNPFNEPFQIFSMRPLILIRWELKHWMSPQMTSWRIFPFSMKIEWDLHNISMQFSTAALKIVSFHCDDVLKVKVQKRNLWKSLRKFVIIKHILCLCHWLENSLYYLLESNLMIAFNWNRIQLNFFSNSNNNNNKSHF